jgi:hypothetical protein
MDLSPMVAKVFGGLGGKSSTFLSQLQKLNKKATKKRL